MLFFACLQDGADGDAPIINDRFLTVAQAAELLQLDPDTLRLLARQGKVPAASVGRQWRFDPVLLREWIREHSLQGIANPRLAECGQTGGPPGGRSK